MPRRARLGAALSALFVTGCPDAPWPEPDALVQPSGLAIGPGGDRLFVTSGNWDGSGPGGRLLVVDLDRWSRDLAGRTGGCRVDDVDPDVLRCDPAQYIDVDQTRRLGDGVGNIAVDPRGGDDDAFRLLVTQRSPAAIWWIDVGSSASGRGVDCGQDLEGSCSTDHQVGRRPERGGGGLPADPSRVVIDDQGYRFAYVPHLTGGALSLVALDGDRGPALVSTAADFFSEASVADLPEQGGFSVASRACDPAAPPSVSRGCSRPMLISTERYRPALREFTVAPGVEALLPGGRVPVEAVGVEQVVSRPVMGDLAFEDPRRSESLLVVQTTPGALARVASVLDAEDRIEHRVVDRVPICANPNLLAIHRPEDRPAMAVVSCFAVGRLAVVDLRAFAVVASIEVGKGPNEIAIDQARGQAYVANVLDDTISVVGLAPDGPGYLREWARLGVVR